MKKMIKVLTITLTVLLAFSCDKLDTIGYYSMKNTNFYSKSCRC